MIHEDFKYKLGNPETTGKIDTALVKINYQSLLDKFTDSNVLIEYLAHYGQAIFREGLFSFINPLEYEILLKENPKLSHHSIMPFAKTAMGNFYLIGEVDGESCIAFYNIHTEEYRYVVHMFSFFFEILAGSKQHIIAEWYGNFEFPALEQYGPVGIDECLTFVPALALGGNEDIKNIQKVKLKENLKILAQAFS